MKTKNEVTAKCEAKETRILPFPKNGQIKLGGFFGKCETEFLYYRKDDSKIILSKKSIKGAEKKKAYHNVERLTNYRSSAIYIPKKDRFTGMITINVYENYVEIETAKSERDNSYTFRSTGYVNVSKNIVFKENDLKKAGLNKSSLGMVLDISGGTLRFVNSDVQKKLSCKCTDLAAVDGNTYSVCLSRMKTMHVPVALQRAYDFVPYTELETKVTNDSIIVKLPEKCAATGQKIRLGENCERLNVSASTVESLSLLTQQLSTETNVLLTLLQNKLAAFENVSNATREAK